MPVGDGGPQRGLSLPASTVLITRGVSNGGRTDLYSQVLAFWRLFGGVWRLKSSVTAFAPLESTVGL